MSTTHALIVSVLLSAAKDWSDICRELRIYEHVSSQFPAHAAPIHFLECMVTKIIADRMSFERLEKALLESHLFRCLAGMEKMRAGHFPGISHKAVIADYPKPFGTAEAVLAIDICSLTPAAAPAPALAAVPVPVPVAAAVAVAPGAEQSTLSHSGPVRVHVHMPLRDTLPDNYRGYSRLCLLLSDNNNWEKVCIAIGIQPVVVRAKVHANAPPGDFARKFVDILKQRAIGMRALAVAYENVTGDSSAIYAACANP